MIERGSTLGRWGDRSDETLGRRIADSGGPRHLWLRKRPRFQTVEGRVYARFDEVRGPADPVVGAKVSNNWDQTTATTDSSGFVIRVRRVAADEFMSFVSKPALRQLVN